MINTTQSDAAGTPPVAVDKTVPTPRTRRMSREPKSNAKQPEDKTGDGKVERKASPPAQPKAPRGPSKIASVIALLERKQGATLVELVEATGWLPHTTRAALTGLKKKGHVISKDKRDDVTCYRIVKAA
ncbi:MAG: DUF3489 domain-containing protein [Novosphingobium sp.]|nr:DUF3489 domain-containing protein [Novosphingobium sp.]